LIIFFSKKLIETKKLNNVPMRQLKIVKQITNRESLSLNKYLHEISKIELIDSKREVELTKRIKEGDNKAFEELVKANLKFVISVAKQYQNQGLSLIDLINEGNVGLIKAARRFDETKGFKFISYAVWWIRQSILQSLAENSRIIRLPLNKIGIISKINKIYSSLSQEYKREPTAKEVASKIKTNIGTVENALIYSSRPISMDAPVYDDNSDTFYDILCSNKTKNPDNDLIKKSLTKEIERTLSSLNKRDADVIRYYYGLKDNRQHTLEEIGRIMGLTRERVRQIKERTIKKLKTNCHNHLLRNYLCT